MAFFISDMNHDNNTPVSWKINTDPVKNDPLKGLNYDDDNFFTNLGQGWDIGSISMISGAKKAVAETVFAVDPGNDFAAELSYKADQYRKTAPQSDGSVGQFIGQLIPSTIPSAAAVGATLVSGGLAAPVALASIGTLGLSSAGSGMYEYEDYQKRNNLPVDKTDMFMVGMAYASAEMIAERVGLNKLTGNASKVLWKGNKDIAKKTSANVLEQYFKKDPKKFQELGKKIAAAGNVEGLEELSTSVAQDLVSNGAFRLDKDDATVAQIIKNAGASYLAGTLMGTFMGPLSYASQNKAHHRRRRTNKFVQLAEDTQSGDVVELFQQTDNGYMALTPHGKEYEIPSDQIGRQASVGTDQFYNLLNDKGDLSAIQEEEARQGAKQEKELRKQAYQEYERNFTPGEKGNPVLKRGIYKGIPVNIVGSDNNNPNLVYISSDDDSQKRPAKLSDIEDLQEIPAEVVYQQIVGVTPSESAEKDIQEDERQPFSIAPIQVGEELSHTLPDGTQINGKITGIGEGMVNVEIADPSGEGFEMMAIPIDEIDQFRNFNQYSEEEDAESNSADVFDEESGELKPMSQDELINQMKNEESDTDYELKELPITTGKEKKPVSIRIFKDGTIEVDRTNMLQKEATDIATKLNEKYPKANYVVEDLTPDDPLAESDWRVAHRPKAKKEEQPLSIEKDGKIIYNKAGEEGLTPREIFDRGTQFKNDNNVTDLTGMQVGDAFYNVNTGAEFEVVSKSGSQVKVKTLGKGLQRVENLNETSKSYLPLNRKSDDDLSPQRNDNGAVQNMADPAQNKQEPLSTSEKENGQPDQDGEGDVRGEERESLVQQANEGGIENSRRELPKERTSKNTIREVDEDNRPQEPTGGEETRLESNESKESSDSNPIQRTDSSRQRAKNTNGNTKNKAKTTQGKTNENVQLEDSLEKSNSNKTNPKENNTPILEKSNGVKKLTANNKKLTEKEAFENAHEEVKMLVYQYNELENDSHLSIAELKIKEKGGLSVTKEDFDKYGDANLRKGNKGTERFFRKNAQPLDSQAEELGVSEQDIINYIINPPARFNPKKAELNRQYKEATGYNINYKNIRETVDAQESDLVAPFKRTLPGTPKQDDVATLKGKDVEELSSQALSPFTPKKRDKVEKEAKEVMKDWKNAPKLVVYESLLDFSTNEPRYFDQWRQKAGSYNRMQQIPAFYSGDRVVLIANNQKNSTKSGILENVLHESFGHYGFRGFINSQAQSQGKEFKEEFDNLLDEIANSYENTPEFKALQRTYGIEGEATKAEKREIAEELIAHRAEKGINDSIMAKVIEWFRKMYRQVTGKYLKLNDSEIQGILSNARRFVAVGDSMIPREVVNPSIPMPQVMMAKRVDNSKEFIKFESDENDQNNSQRESEGKFEESYQKPFQAASNDIRRNRSTAGTQQQRLDSENKAALQYAKDNDLWIDDLYSLGKHLPGAGVENTLAIDSKGEYIFKSNNLMLNEGSVTKLLDRTQAHNAIYPETAYELVGFTGIDNGSSKAPTVQVIIKQKYIADARQATQEEIDQFKKDSGYTKDGEEFEKDNIIIGDLRPRNVLNKDGVIYVIDPFVDFNESLKNLNDVQDNLRFKRNANQFDIFDQTKKDKDAETKRDVLRGQLKTAGNRMKELNKLQSANKSAARVLEIRTIQKEIIRLTEAISKTKNREEATRGGEQQTLFKRAPKVDSKEFKEWFGDSKVVDEKGDPLVVYHGTDSEFSEFKKPKENLMQMRSDVGFWFTGDKSETEKYGDRTVDVYLSIQKPRKISQRKLDELAVSYPKDEVIRRLKQGGHDGLIIEEIKTNRATDTEFQAEQYVAFSPIQIKSATGNNGQFDKNNPDIRFKRAPEEGTRAFERWKGEATEYQGPEVQGIKSGEPVMIKAYHGTTNGFYEFDSSVKGNIEGHLGKVNYFTSDPMDAASNYQSDGKDLTNRIEQRKERLVYALEELTVDEIEDQYNVDWDEVYPKGIPEDIDYEELAEYVASNELKGGEEKVLDLWVKLNNPLVLGNKPTWIESIPLEEYEDYLDDAAQEIADEYDIDVEEAKSDYDSEVRDRAIESAGIWENRIVTAMQQAIQENTDEDIDAGEVLGEATYDSEIDLNQLEENLRKSEGLVYAESEDGLASSQIIAQFFKNLGYDGIILTNVSERFQNMGLSESMSHIHVFDEFNNQIKLASGENTTFDENNPDIRFKKTPFSHTEPNAKDIGRFNYRVQVNKPIEGLSKGMKTQLVEPYSPGGKVKINIGSDGYIEVQANEVTLIDKVPSDQKTKTIQIGAISKGDLKGKTVDISKIFGIDESLEMSASEAYGIINRKSQQYKQLIDCIHANK
jgi:hypothetical protein